MDLSKSKYADAEYDATKVDASADAAAPAVVEPTVPKSPPLSPVATSAPAESSLLTAATSHGMSQDLDSNAQAGFAQTRSPDDLFDDDFVPLPAPVSPPVVARQTQQHIKPSQQGPPPNTPSGPRGRGGSTQRGPRGRNNAGRSNAGHAKATTSETTIPPAPIPVEEPENVERNEGNDKAATSGGAASNETKEERRPTAVRGDRSGTGGVKKPKLSESELSERLASIALKNAAREEAHRRAEADEASFQQREQQEAVKRHAERQNRRELEGERERNRLRKLKAVAGREWDAEKDEADALEADGRASQFRRGAYGGVVGNVGTATAAGRGAPPESSGDEASGGRRRGGRGGGFTPRGSRGRGSEEFRGGRGRGGRGRGAFHPGPANSHGHDGQRVLPDLAAVEKDFPALPSTAKPSAASLADARETVSSVPVPEVDGTAASSSPPPPPPHPPEASQHVESKPSVALSPAAPDATWAEEVESGVSAKES
ncbi:MAG: hypothetical protein M1825_000006 [Sarcosagium campestre]|nr:MAG: hypothetical protein M1825_000006 [Sarcosagium campestre]